MSIEDVIQSALSLQMLTDQDEEGGRDNSDHKVYTNKKEKNH